MMKPRHPMLHLVGETLAVAVALAMVAFAGAGCGPAVAVLEDSEVVPPPVTLVPASVIPAPASLTAGEGFFRLGTSTVVQTVPAFEQVVESQVAALRRTTGLELRAGSAGPLISVAAVEGLPEEAYELRVTSQGVTIVAAAPAGVFYAFQTLRQLLPAEIESSDPVAEIDWVLPAVDIADVPRFPYRGLHLDVGRHFFDVEFVKKYIDTMARFKLNRFHWHLTEDQGWRIQIDSYPKLTAVGAWRDETTLEGNTDPYIGDGRPHGGFYTKNEVRDVVAYAAARFVTVIPEIEMPGHATAAIAAYPELGCTDAQLAVSTNWGVHDTIFCPQESTFEFVEAVLAEVVEMFPSEYIHIGADEVPKRQWKESAVAQGVMRREGLADEEELQSWFVRRAEAYLRSHGRSLIGWDEILEGGLAADATVMSWRGTEGGIEAARRGHDVIMTPVEHAYFDFYQADPATEPLAMNWAGFGLPLETVYAFEPVPDVLTTEESRHILGPQGNLWTEYIATPEHAEYMAYPRAVALAEVAWSPREARDWPDFMLRLGEVMRHLDVLDINYRVPDGMSVRRP